MLSPRSGCLSLGPASEAWGPVTTRAHRGAETALPAPPLGPRSQPPAGPGSVASCTWAKAAACHCVVSLFQK